MKYVYRSQQIMLVEKVQRSIRNFLQFLELFSLHRMLVTKILFLKQVVGNKNIAKLASFFTQTIFYFSLQFYTPITRKMNDLIPFVLTSVSDRCDLKHSILGNSSGACSFNHNIKITLPYTRTCISARTKSDPISHEPKMSL